MRVNGRSFIVSPRLGHAELLFSFGRVMLGDIVSPLKRRAIMQAVRRKGTAIELEVAKLVRSLGHRATTNSATLPGSPDLSNRRAMWAVFVHGCFWHGHSHCRKTKGGSAGRIPATNRRFWEQKIAANRARDASKAQQLRRKGFRVLTVWECEVRDTTRLLRRLDAFFSRVH